MLHRFGRRLSGRGLVDKQIFSTVRSATPIGATLTTIRYNDSNSVLPYPSSLSSQWSHRPGSFHTSSLSSSSHPGPKKSSGTYLVASIPVESIGKLEPSHLIQIRNQPFPTGAPSSNQVLIQVAAATVNPIDTMICQGYGRNLVPLASQVMDVATPMSERLTEDNNISIGREGSGRIIQVGSGVWDLQVGDHVWFAPSIANSAFGEFLTISRNEVSRAPKQLNHIEAATHPFAITTAWTALVNCAGLTPTPLEGRSHEEHHSDITGAISRAGNKILNKVESVPLLRPLAERLHSLCPIHLSSDAPKRAVIHGASGQVGLAAVQLLQHWGYEVYATTNTATRESLDKLKEKQSKSQPSAADNLHIINTEEDSIESIVSPRSIAVFLDGVGGDSTFKSALPLMVESGQFVTLRGDGVKMTDEKGLLQGTVTGGAHLLSAKSQAAEYGVNYSWAVNRPIGESLEYVRVLMDRGLFYNGLLPIDLWHGLDSTPNAVQAAADQKGKSARQVVIINSDEVKRNDATDAKRATSKPSSSSTSVGSSAHQVGNSRRSFSTYARSFSTANADSSSSPCVPPFRLVLFASSDFSIPTLHALRANSDQLLRDGTCVVVMPADKPTGRGQILQPTQFKLEVEKIGFKIVQLPPTIDFKMTGWDLPESVRNAVDVGVVVSFGYMLPDSLIRQFPCGVINLHPSLLPLYRGSSPIQFAIAHGDKETGVSIIDVHPTQLDGGDIIRQVKTPVPSGSTFSSLSSELAAVGAQELITVLKDLSAMRQKRLPQEQNDTGAAPSVTPPIPSTVAVTYTIPARVSDPEQQKRLLAPRIPKSAGELLFAMHPPERLYRVWAGLKGFTPSYTNFGNIRVNIHSLIEPTAADAKLKEAELKAATEKNRPSTTESFPTLEDAHQIGVGGIFYQPALNAIGVVCANSTVANPRVIYVTEVQLSGKKSVSGQTFASGYLNKFKMKTPDAWKSWKFTQTIQQPEEDFFANRL